MARAKPASSTPTPAISEIRKIPLISLTHARSGFKSCRRQRFTALGEMLEMHGLAPGRGVIPGRVPLVVEPGLPEVEQLLELRLAVDQAGDLRDAHDLARAAAHTLRLDDDVDRRGDLLLDRPPRPVGSGQPHDVLKAPESAVGR